MAHQGLDTAEIWAAASSKKKLEGNVCMKLALQIIVIAFHADQKSSNYRGEGISDQLWWEKILESNIIQTVSALFVQSL